MSRDSANLLKEALDLPTEERAALADSLLESLDVKLDENAEAAWHEEIRRRFQEIDHGAVELIPRQDAQRRLRARLQR